MMSEECHNADLPIGQLVMCILWNCVYLQFRSPFHFVSVVHGISEAVEKVISPTPWSGSMDLILCPAIMVLMQQKIALPILGFMTSSALMGRIL